jgi:SAM-dependent methyltransferase
MPIETIHFAGKKYPKFQSEGFAARWVFPFAMEVCKGFGYDIGCNRLAWCLPNSVPIDPQINYTSDEVKQWFSNRTKLLHAINSRPTDAFNLPWGNIDYIFSSHCLEHLPNWISALEYWKSMLVSKGVLFLYLPHPDQEYWSPWNNRKHIHILYPKDIYNYLNAGGWTNIFVSERDLNHSFVAMAERV